MPLNIPLKFKPKFSITNEILKKLPETEAVKERVKSLPLTPKVPASFRESSKLFSARYSTMTEGNRLTQKEVSEILLRHKQIKDRERDEKEIKGYYIALDKVQSLFLKKPRLRKKT